MDFAKLEKLWKRPCIREEINKGMSLDIILRYVSSGVTKALGADATPSVLSSCEETIKLASTEPDVLSSRTDVARYAAIAVQHARPYYTGDHPEALNGAITLAYQCVQQIEPSTVKQELRNVRIAVTQAEKKAGLYASWVGIIGAVFGIFSALVCVFAFLFVRQLIFGSPPAGPRVDFLGIAVLLIGIALGAGVAVSLRNGYKRRSFSSAIATNPAKVASACVATAAFHTLKVTSASETSMRLPMNEAIEDAACAIALVEPARVCELVNALINEYHARKERSRLA